MPTIDVKIPPMGESILTGVLAKWRVADGDIVARDQPLFELETDKITSEGMAEAAGKITLRTAEGTEVKIGEVVATIDTDVTAGAASAAEPAPAPSGAKAAASAAPVSPAVARIAAETGIDPATVPGTGKGGRVTKADLLAAAEAAAPQPPPPAAPSPAPAPASDSGSGRNAAAPAIPAGRQTRKKLSPLRKRLAERLVQAQHQAAMLTTFNEVDMSAVMELRKKYQDDFVKKNGIKLGFMSFFTKAVVHALQAVPGINARIEGDEIVQNSYYDVGVAVSTDKGLMVPVIRDCDTVSMAGIEKQLGDLAKKARDGKITLPDLEGGVFTITNGGIFGSMLSTPILNAPQSAILGLHAINERPVAINGQVVIRPMMYLALSYDHRLVDGKEAVTFLVKVKQAIEDPTRLLLNL
ncbi:2-oxoglutarate dehydrogenase complex dihydrolipoamide succinyltransferase [Opitutaceae bacterium TAV1]|nr:2-oxoglutarate dehydrogenase complex dihydrolipoamide succinyltransferase [Opitutaceae bacterium TAV1]